MRGSIIIVGLGGMSGIITLPKDCYFFGKPAYVYLSKTHREVEMTTHAKHHIPWFLWPFAAIWKLLTIIVELTGGLVALVLGIFLLIVGVIDSLTVIGAIIGIPLAIVGLLLFLKGIF